jgi:ribosomal protein S18 acetylase RimI-like enzyme
MITIRRATRSDIEAILNVYNDDDRRPVPIELSRIDEYARVFDAIDCDPNDGIYIAERDGIVVGTFQLGQTAHVELVHVAKHARGQGVGQSMMRQAITMAREKGCIRVQLTSNKSRTRAHAFYERLGFGKSHEGMTLYL